MITSGTVTMVPAAMIAVYGWVNEFSPKRCDGDRDRFGIPRRELAGKT